MPKVGLWGNDHSLISIKTTRSSLELYSKTSFCTQSQANFIDCVPSPFPKRADTNPTMPSSPPPKGIYVPVPTFFAKEGSANYDPISPPLDLETQSEHSLFLVKGGIKGLVILGSTGEAIFVRNSERHALIKSQRKTLDDAGYKDRPIIAGTATQNIDDTVEMIKDSKDAGAEYAMVCFSQYTRSTLKVTNICRSLDQHTLHRRPAKQVCRSGLRL
jgi:hypothetical protein